MSVRYNIKSDIALANKISLNDRVAVPCELAVAISLHSDVPIFSPFSSPLVSDDPVADRAL